MSLLGTLSPQAWSNMGRFTGRTARLCRCVAYVLPVLAALLTGPSAAWAGSEDNLRADALSAEVVGNTVQATLTYTVFDLLPFGNVGSYVIQVGIDRNGDNVIDSVLESFTGSPTLGTHQWSQDIRADLDALSGADRVKNGDRLIAKLDANNNINEFFGAGEGDNVVAATPFYVDIVAKSLVIDAANQATLTYLVDSPAKVHTFRIEFYLDSNLNGSWDPTDTTVFSTVVNGDPGIRVLTADFSANPPAAGQKIFARVDTDNDVAEANENNNKVSGDGAEGNDLIAIALSYDPSTQNAVLNYFVDSANNVPSYNIEFILDSDNSLAPSAGDAIVGLVSGDVTPGPHTTAPFSFGANPPVSGQFVFAYIDRPGALGNPPVTGNVIENDETTNNWVGAANIFTTDLMALALTYDSNTQTATLAYSVISPTPVVPYDIRFFVDRNNNGILDGGDPPQVGDVAGATSPGAHVVTQSYAAAPPASNQLIFAVVDFFHAVAADPTGNNTAIGVNTTPTDLVAISLAYDAGAQKAKLSYAVQAPIPVPAYNIEFILDSDHSGTLTPGDALIATVAGQTAPGDYTLEQSYAANPADSGQFLFAYIDRPGASGNPPVTGNVIETDETGDNVVATANTATTDLVAVSLSYDASTKNASLTYLVNSPIPVSPYLISFILDTDHSGTITGGDVVVTTVNGDINPGAHVLTASFAGNPPASGQDVFAKVDVNNTVTEINEGDNVAMAVNTAPTDLVANLLGSLTYDSNTQTATLNYEVISPTNTPAYSIMFILDSDHNFVPSFGDTIVGLQAGNTSPGLHTTTQAFAGPNAPASGQAIFAILDRPPPLGGNVVESDETNNIAGTINTATTDLVAQSLTYDSNTKLATLDYVVFSPTNVAGNAIQFCLETNGTPGLQIGPGGDQIIAVIPGEVTPGGHTATASYNLAPPATGQFLYATVDTANQVAESNEGNNLASAIDTAPTDLVVVSLAFDSNTKAATLSYTVISPTNVPAYNIEFFLDRNNSGLLDLGDGPVVAVVPGQTAPGSYTATANFGGAGNMPATGQFLFAIIDRLPNPNGNVAESNENNNLATTLNTQGTDLVANSVQVISDDVNNRTTAKVAYTIYSPLPVNPFSLKVGIDRDGNGVIDGGGSDVLTDVLVSSVADRSPGAHTFETPDFRPALNSLPFLSRIQYGTQIVATLDLLQDGSPAGAVTETEEISNNKVATRPIVDLVADAIAVFTDPSADTTKAAVAYTVNSPGAVEKFKIRIGVDRNNDGVIDDPSDVLKVINIDGSDLEPGPHSITSGDFRAALSGVSPPLKEGDYIIASLDLLQNNTPENKVIELGEVTNNVTTQKQRIDLVADAINVSTDVAAGTTEADVAYTVNSPGSVAPFSLKIGVDRNGDGKIDNPDGLLANVTLTGSDLDPGPHAVTVPGLRAALNGLTTPLQNGDTILATLDLKLNGTNEGAVKEDVEVDNNAVGEIQTVDLVANSIAVTSDDIAGTTLASVSYTINSPANVADFDIRVGVDRDGNGVIDSVGDVLVTSVAPNLTPGTHTFVSADLRVALEALALRLQNGDRIIATLDLQQNGVPVNDVLEADEAANNVAAQAQLVDLVANEVSLFTEPAGAKKARVSYTVNSPGTVESFKVRIGLDTNGNGVLDPGSVIRIYDIEPDIGVAGVQPGAHQITTDDLTPDLNALALQDGYRIIATLDLKDVDPYNIGAENAVVESEEIDNNRVYQPLAVDLVAISLAYDSNINLATLSYLVDSWGGVPAYNIKFYLDDNPKNGVLDPTDTLVATVPGNQLPGGHTAIGDYNAIQVNSTQFIFAVIDTGNTVAESNETNNTASTDNTEITDLVANSISVVSDNVADTTTAKVAYTIIAPDPFAVPPFNILIGVDRNGDNKIDSPADVLATIAAPDLTPGSHSVTSGNLRAALEGLATRLNNGDRILAMLDLTYDGVPVNSVVEIGGDEVGNNVAAFTVQVDLVATSVDVYRDPSTGNILARTVYTVNSPGTVHPFKVRIGVDRDGDKIIDPASLLATIDLAAQPITALRPGSRSVSTGDLTAALNGLAIPLQDGNQIIATLDILDDGFGTPENLVIEAEEQTNNVALDPVTVDLVAQSIFLTVDNVAGTTAVTVAYTVNSIGAVSPFKLRIGIDRNGDNVIDALTPADLLLTATQTLLADRTPGPHVFQAADIRPAINALNPPIKSGDRIITTLDLTQPGLDEGAVKEVNEIGNNVTSLAGTQSQIVDISANHLTLTVGSFVATFDYTVTSPGDVAPFRIQIGRDTNNDNVIDQLLADLAGDPTPGPHQITQDLAPALLASGVVSGSMVKIVVDVDALNDVVEASESNNKLTASAAYKVDLDVGTISMQCAVADQPFDVVVTYAVDFNAPTENFSICAYASGDQATTLSAGDISLGCVTVSTTANKAVGNHTVTIPGVTVSGAAFPTSKFFVKVRLDDGSTVAESNESNNFVTRPGAYLDPSQDSDGDGVPDCVDPAPNDPNIPTPAGTPAGETTPDQNNGLQVFLPILPPGLPTCGIGLCGSGAMIPVGMLIVGIVGLKTQNRRLRNRRR